MEAVVELDGVCGIVEEAATVDDLDVSAGLGYALAYLVLEAFGDAEADDHDEDAYCYACGGYVYG